MTKRNQILAGIGILFLCSLLGASQALGQVTIGGKVVTLEDTPMEVAGATVTEYGTSNSTTSAEDGSWSLTVTDGADPVLKIGATDPGTGSCAAPTQQATVETYVTFPLDLLKGYQTAPYQFDIPALLKADFVGVPDGHCLIIGVAVQYTDLSYPNVYTQLAGVAVTPSLTPVYFAYVNLDGTPCVPPACTETTANGTWIGVEANGSAQTYSGSKTGITFDGGDVTCVANTGCVSGLADTTNLP